MTTISPPITVESIWSEIRNQNIALPFNAIKIERISDSSPAICHDLALSITMGIMLFEIHDASQQHWRYQLRDQDGIELKKGMSITPYHPSVIFIRPYSRNIFRKVDFPTGIRFKVTEVSEVKIGGQHNRQYAFRTDQAGELGILPVDWGIFKIVP